ARRPVQRPQRRHVGADALGDAPQGIAWSDGERLGGGNRGRQGTEAEEGEQAPGWHCQPRYQKVYSRLQEVLHVCGDSRTGARWSFSNEALTFSVRAHRVVPSPPPSRRGASEARVARVEDGVEHLA